MRTPVLLALLMLAGCASTPPPAPTVTIDTRAAVDAVRRAGEPAANELAVRPLLDPGVADLQEQAAAHEAAGRLDEAAQAIQDALALSPDDPALLQSRAEVALLAGELDRALEYSARSYTLGPKVGPLCRRQQETRVQVALAQARTLQGDDAAQKRADAAAADRDACTVTPPPRY